MSNEQCAVTNEHDLTTPDLPRSDSDDPSFFVDVMDTLGISEDQVTDLIGFAHKTDKTQEVTVPNELNLDFQDTSWLDSIKSWLGFPGAMSYYNHSMPQEKKDCVATDKLVRVGPIPIPGTGEANDNENCYESSTFPEGVNWVTGE